MPEPELDVHQITKWVPSCESGRHAAHPYETCDEAEELAAVVGSWFVRLFAEAYANAERRWLYGGGVVEEPLPAWLDGSIEDGPMSALHQAVDATVYGNGTGEPRGFLTAQRLSVPYAPSDTEVADHGLIFGEPEPTPVERALSILDPHLRACPLYDAGPPRLSPMPS